MNITYSSCSLLSDFIKLSAYYIMCMWLCVRMYRQIRHSLCRSVVDIVILYDPETSKSHLYIWEHFAIRILLRIRDDSLRLKLNVLDSCFLRLPCNGDSGTWSGFFRSVTFVLIWIQKLMTLEKRDHGSLS